MMCSLKGSSLVEALVASVIFLTVFMIAMTSLVNITKLNLSTASVPEMELAVGECMDKFSLEFGTSASYGYEWGHVEITTVPYRSLDDLLEVTASAKAKRGGDIIYRYILCTGTD